jgi:hypothetical protein
MLERASRPRIAAGEISAMYAGHTTLAAPTPTPITKRASVNSAAPLARADAAAVAAKMIAVAP